ncbi:ROK family transcriptional regulator [Thermoactinospora rubra]|uniref:ROK family transcriptional regulator n=1 Tax=Thermoactinospora rubra TaxID=1088767 RepID=UPI001F0B707C|nr:ROK family transcriptional regulator [Thermoactinospora rubra]
MKTATPATARAINDRLALDLLLQHGPLTAPQLRELTGLSRPTVSDLLERLRADGLIEIAGEAGEDRRGPNARLYGLVGGRAFVAGVDVRRHAVNVTVADITGRSVGSAVREIGGDVELDRAVAEAVGAAAGGRALHVVALGVPGLIDPHTGGLGDSDVPGWRPDLQESVRRRLGVRVILENEVNLAAIAEHRLGAAVGREDFVLLWLDDGVGAAVVLGGRLRRGASGGAGEVGFLEVDGESFCCTVEAAVARRLERAELAERIAKGAFSVVAVLDPGLVVLGGATGRAGGEELAALVAERIGARFPAPTQVRPSTVEGNAILQGAVLVALELARDEVYG